METQILDPLPTTLNRRTTWTIDPAHTNIGFAVKHVLIATVHGRFGGVRGTIRRDDDHPHNAEVEVEIDTATVDTGNSTRDNHLRSADFFDVARFPTITFRGTRVEPAGPFGRGRWNVVGDLTIRGVTRSIQLTAEETGRGVDQAGTDVVGFEASTKINRKDFGMTFNVPLAEGGFVVGDEVKISIDVEARRQG
jgi:polyisoprenoid-binding protein YceI